MKSSIPISDLVIPCLEEDSAQYSAAKKCRTHLEQLPLPVLEYICNDPLSSIFKEKNIFTLGKNFFTEKTINLLGCNTATTVLLKPIKFIQENACLIVDPEKKQEIRDFSMGLETIGKRCSLSVSKTTKQYMNECALNYTNTTAIQELKKNITIRQSVCIEKIKNVPLGDKIKICDDIFNALNPELHDYIAANPLSAFFKLRNRFANAKQHAKRDARCKLNEEQQRRAFWMQSYFMGQRLMEKTACSQANRTDVPFAKNKPLFNLIKLACFLPPTQTHDKDTEDAVCETFIKNFNHEEKSQLCADPSLIFHDLTLRNFFATGINRIQTLCRDEPAMEQTKEALHATLTMLKDVNETNGIMQNLANDKSKIPENTLLPNTLVQYDKAGPYLLKYRPNHREVITDNLMTNATANANSALISATFSSMAVVVAGFTGLSFWLCRKFAGKNRTRGDKVNEKMISPKQVHV
jgi:hypothetical protein